ncbi:MAG: glycoside hydrolase family 5 protein [Oscillospiraceae bacterium]
MITLFAALLLFTSCSISTGQSTSTRTPDDIFSGGTPDIEGYEIPSSIMNISSQQLVSNIRIGWNLGNTLDACIADLDGNTLPDATPPTGKVPDETLWGNPPASEQLFRSLVDSGINAVRLPITWRGHIDRDFNIDEDWLNRVQQVVDYAFDCGMYVIITMYHDGAPDDDYGAWIRKAPKEYDLTLEHYTHLWEQIAEKFRTYNERLLYESMNEVEFYGTPVDEAYDLLNKLNQAFVDTIRSNGGNNLWRHLVIAGYNADISDSCDPRFIMPEDIMDNCILSVHYYTPVTFCRQSVRNFWGLPSEQQWMTHQIEQLRKNFTDKGIPVMITEYGAKGSDAASRVFFCEMLTKLCHDSGIATFLWDDGSEFDRTAMEWRTPELIVALQRASGNESYTPEKLEITD